MHPEIARKLIAQRGHEMRTQAHQANLARMLRARRHGAVTPDEADVLVVPDFVDGSFLTVPAHDQSADQPGQVTATHRAA